MLPFLHLSPTPAFQQLNQQDHHWRLGWKATVLAPSHIKLLCPGGAEAGSWLVLDLPPLHPPSILARKSNMALPAQEALFWSHAQIHWKERRTRQAH